MRAYHLVMIAGAAFYALVTIDTAVVGINKTFAKAVPAVRETCRTNRMAIMIDGGYCCENWPEFCGR